MIIMYLKFEFNWVPCILSAKSGDPTPSAPLCLPLRGRCSFLLDTTAPSLVHLLISRPLILMGL